MDKQKQRMKEHDPNKLRITYKKEGDGFQCDALCNYGYIFTFFTQTFPKKYTDQGLSSLHTREMSMFDTVIDINHTFGVENLYSTKFCKDAYQKKI